MRRSFVIIFLTFLFLALRVEHSVLFYDLGRDKRYQMTAAANLVAGNGMSLCKTFPDDIAKVSCDELTWWAAGYPIILGGLYLLTEDLIRADFVMVVLGLLVFLFASYRVFTLWSDPADERCAFGAFLIFAGFSFTPFNYFSTNDLLSTGFLILAIVEASIGISQRRKYEFVLAGLAVFGSVFFKFSFYPFIAVIPVGLVFMAYLRRDRAPINYFIYFAVPLCLCFVALLVTFPHHILPPDQEWTTGWNWHNLTSQDPFGAKGLFFIDFLFRRLDPTSPIGIASLILIHAFSTVAVGSVIYLCGWYTRNSYRSEDRSGRTLFTIFSILTIAISVGYLLWLSLRMPTFYHPIYGAWTFVQETRYYGPAMVLLIYAVFITPLHLNHQKSILRTASVALAIAISSYAVVYWGYKNFDYFYNERIEGSFAGSHRDDAAVGEFLKLDESLDRSKTVLGFMSHAGAYGYPILLVKTDPAKFPFPWYDWHAGAMRVSTSEPRTLLVTIHKSPTEAERALLDRYQNARILELSTYDLYRLEIVP